MRSLTSHTVLRRAPSLNIELGVNAVIHLGGSRITARGHVLSILEAFAYPVPLSKALDALSQRLGAEAWIELVSSIKHLYMTGVLVDEQGTAPVIGGVWSAPAVHISMLNDRARTASRSAGRPKSCSRPTAWRIASRSSPAGRRGLNCRNGRTFWWPRSSGTTRSKKA